MLKLTRCVACAAVLISGLSGCKQAPTADLSKSEVRDALMAFQKAMVAHDLNGIKALYAPDVVAYDLVPPLQYKGMDAYGQDFQEFLAMYPGAITLEFTDMHVVTSGDVAYVFGLQHFTGVKADGGKDDMWMRFTSGYKKVDGKWLDVHDHVSVPVDMKTGMGALKLTP